MVSDETEEIVDAVNALRAPAITYVFTTGGIGPTHDDITADAVAKAFGVALPINAEARAHARKPLESRPAPRSTRRGCAWRAFPKAAP